MVGTRRRRGRSVSVDGPTHPRASFDVRWNHANTNSTESEEYHYELPPRAEHRSCAADQSNPKALLVGTARARSPLSAATRIPGFVSAVTLLGRQPTQRHMAFMSGRGSSSNCDRRRTALIAAAVRARTCQVAASSRWRRVPVVSPVSRSPVARSTVAQHRCDTVGAETAISQQVGVVEANNFGFFLTLSSSPTTQL